MSSNRWDSDMNSKPITEYRYSVGQIQEEEDDDLPRFTIESESSNGGVFLRTQRKSLILQE